MSSGPDITGHVALLFDDRLDFVAAQLVAPRPDGALVRLADPTLLDRASSTVSVCSLGDAAGWLVAVGAIEARPAPELIEVSFADLPAAAASVLDRWNAALVHPA